MTGAPTANFAWNPFVPIQDRTQAAALARGGVWAAGLAGLSYVLTIVPHALSGRLFTLEPAAAVALASATLAVAFAAGLAWRLQAKRSAIAAGLLLLWISAETAGDLWATSHGLDVARTTSVLVDLFSLILAIQAWRGAMVLRRASPAG